jgi:ATP-dependent RNA helicase RhlE
MRFDELNLSSQLLDALSDMGFETPTPIQAKAFSVIMSGRDVVGLAQTGTGKTLAYLLPLLRMQRYAEQKEPRILILVPTRELVVQVVEEVKKLTTYMTLRVEGIFGGVNINTQKIVLSHGVDVVVATPGRLMDLALCRALNLKGVKHLVIDEVDEMLNLGFRTQLTNILDLLPRRRQNLLFSATMTEEVDTMIHTFFNAPETLEVTRAGTPLARIRQMGYYAPNFYTKLNLLEHLLKTDASMQKVLVFGPSKRMADLIHKHLASDFPDQFAVIHSNKSQNYRFGAVQQFEEGAIRGLIATDILARGIDVSDVTHVVSIDTPDTPELYIHRIGRTGRADQDGDAILMVSEKEKPALAAIEELMEKAVPMHDMPEAVLISTYLTDDERDYGPEKTYHKFGAGHQGAFHEKKDKNKKVNLGNAKKRARAEKYKKPIKKKKLR